MRRNAASLSVSADCAGFSSLDAARHGQGLAASEPLCGQSIDLASTHMEITMPTLDPSQATQFRGRLRQRAAQLRGEIRNTLTRTSDETHVRIAEPARDKEDDSFSNLIVDLNFADIDRDSDELRRIDAALARLSDGSYGTCIDCDRPIAAARLAVEPTAERCIRCQETYEKTHATEKTPSL